VKKQYSIQTEVPIPLELIMTLIALYSPFLTIPFILISWGIYFGLNAIWKASKTSIYFGELND
jgi:hypothetical protein